MADANSTTPPPTDASSATMSAEELTAKAVHKRYEGLVMVRTKAVRGKGAWYWVHLEPMLVHNSDTGLPKAVKLRCSLCDAVFSASNPSRTASEHLKRGTCPSFSSVAKPISSISPSSVMALPSPTAQHNHRKRSSSDGGSGSPYQVEPLTIVDPSRFGGEITYSQSVAATEAMPCSFLLQPPHLMLSGGKEDLGALAMLENSVKKLKSPKTSPGPTLSKLQIDSALDFLADWVYESGGSVSFSSLEHPKFREFLTHVGLPAVLVRELTGCQLDSKFEEAKAESEVKIRDAMFFQLASDGWKPENYGLFGEENLVNLTVNLPNGTSLYRRAVFLSRSVPSKYAEEVLWETVIGINANAVEQCVGIVADKFRGNALRDLENQNHWMVNLSCQFQGFNSLIKDFIKDLPLFKKVTENCIKLANFINYQSRARTIFHKHQLQERGRAGLIRTPLHTHKVSFEPVFMMLEDVLDSAQALQLVLLDVSNKIVSMEDPSARAVSDLIGNVGFWNEVEAVHSLVKLIKDMAQEIKTERSLVGRCLPLWNELRGKVKDWCYKYRITEGPVEKVIERRFNKNYHPAWAAAFVLDPLYLIKDSSGKYIPPFKCLTTEQEKDVDKLVTRLGPKDEAHIALMELMKWRTEGLDPVYARAVQMKERDPITGRMKVANPQSSRLVWETYLSEFKSLGRVAVRLIFLHATSCGFKCNWSIMKWALSNNRHSRAGIERAQKLIFVAAHYKLERRDFSSDEDKDAELLALENSEGDMLNEVLDRSLT